MEERDYSRMDGLIQDAWTDSRLPLDSRVIFVPLDAEEKKIWMEFKGLHIANPIIYGIARDMTHVPARLMKPDHPIVPIVGKFAVDAFNELCMRYVKKGVHENIYQADIRDVKVSNLFNGYIFYITLEAIEEDLVGVYKAKVLCERVNGTRSLIQFHRTLSRPVGKKFKGTANLIRLTCRYKILKDQKKLLRADMKARSKSVKDMMEAKASEELYYLKKSYKAVKGACRMLYQQLNEMKPVDFEIKKSDPGDWLVPNRFIGLRLRSKLKYSSYRGYDYYTPVRGKTEAKASEELYYLKKSYKAVKGACRMLYQQLNEMKPVDFEIKKSDPGDWLVPNRFIGLRLRPKLKYSSYRGYDYYTPVRVFAHVRGDYIPSVSSASRELDGF